MNKDKLDQLCTAMMALNLTEDDFILPIPVDELLNAKDIKNNISVYDYLDYVDDKRKNTRIPCILICNHIMYSRSDKTILLSLLEPFGYKEPIDSTKEPWILNDTDKLNVMRLFSERFSEDEIIRDDSDIPVLETVWDYIINDHDITVGTNIYNGIGNTPIPDYTKIIYDQWE